MIRWSKLSRLVLAPVIGLALVSLGCGGSDKPKSSGTGGAKGSTSGKTGGTSDTGKAAPKGEKTALTSSGFATIKGKVTFDGTPPAPKSVAFPTGGNKNKDEDYCKKGFHNDESWVVGADKGVKNVVVWVRPPQGKFFDLPADHRKPAQGKVTIGQPFCAFEPHVSVLFPTYYDKDSKSQKKTGQVFEVINNATIAHNTNVQPRYAGNSGFNEVMSAGAKRAVEISCGDENRVGQEETIQIKCNIHPWMTAHVLAFDHPYVAVTGADGTFEIKNVPAGSELMLVGWHEAAEYTLPEGSGSRQGMKIEALKAGETREINFKVKQ